VHIWKFLLWFCAFLVVPHVILCIFGRSWWDFEYAHNLRGSSENVQNPMIDFK
jgi:hypothetical protein